jgi:two-component system, NtrC family, nitrogen regulation response regulator GlnG
MADHLLDSPTLVPGGDTTAHGDARLLRALALTIIWHPDVRRIGESAVLSAAPCDLSRLEPLFGDRSPTAPRFPLADVYISSREPSLTLRPTADGIEIVPRNPSAHVKVDGQRLLNPLALTRAAVDRGIVITLARRIVLCLHLARPTRAAARRAHGLIGVSDAMDDTRREIDQVADLNVPVLIRGESGTGKGMVATAIVAASPRANEAFLSLNMGATVPSTAASELFGHERGSFTGASVAKVGLFAAADGGSLFLDEIGLTPPDVRPMLLHVLETAEIRPLGATRAQKIDVRFIAATDANLERAIGAGAFSEALLQRLARYQITMPPLRDRREDFGVLLVHLLRTAFRKHGEPDRLTSSAEPWLSASTVASLAQHRWPGNIREVENVAGQIVVSSRGQTTATLPKSVLSMLSDEENAAAPAPGPLTPSGTKALAPSGISDEQLADALARSNGSASRAAKILGVSRTTYYELRKRNPNYRSVTAIPDEELLACHDECAGDVAMMADRLRVPLKALKDRLAQFSRRRR